MDFIFNKIWRYQNVLIFLSKDIIKMICHIAYMEDTKTYVTQKNIFLRYEKNYFRPYRSFRTYFRPNRSFQSKLHFSEKLAFLIFLKNWPF